MAFTFAQLRAQWAAFFSDSAPDGSITPEADLETRTDLLDTLEEAFENIPAGPQGAQGVQGIPGPVGPVGPAGLEWRGAWAAVTSYVENDAVGFGGASYFCIADIAGDSDNENPAADSTHWVLLAAQGAQGIQGVQGPQGPQGAPGPGAGTLTLGGVVKATPAAPLIYGFNSVTGGSGSVKLPDGTSTNIGGVIYVICGNSTIVESYNASNLIYFGRGTTAQLPYVKIDPSNIWRFINVGSGVWIAEKVIEGFREYRVRLSQTGLQFPLVAYTFVNDIVIPNVSFPNPLYRLINFQYIGVGQYSVRLNAPMAVGVSSNNLEVSFSDNKARITNISNGTDSVSLNYVQVDFETRNTDGDLADGILNYCNLYMRYYG
jgi:hypothetical protein